eukprot:CAMPEP_0182837280 /NCGR_PEP_ID=MMETSP0006_2-20121128/22615_1 /TAXON_ID=97485 /ORGANISM="Prymnesium parvum, Strain Texoma1" /LENGTH=49 /DNA_ID=CAMNT_0024966085 /DNA_START=9 /DNA_END=158 /DNA_ORIENTATION=-
MANMFLPVRLELPKPFEVVRTVNPKADHLRINVSRVCLESDDIHRRAAE